MRNTFASRAIDRLFVERKIVLHGKKRTSHQNDVLFQPEETYSARITFALQQVRFPFQRDRFAFVRDDLLLVERKIEIVEKKIENIDHDALPVWFDFPTVSANLQILCEDIDYIGLHVQPVARNMPADTHDPAVAKDRIEPLQRKRWP